MKLPKIKIPKILKSRTVWTVVILFLINGVTAIREFFPPNLLPLVDGLLGIATIYFRANPKVEFKNDTE